MYTCMYARVLSCHAGDLPDLPGPLSSVLPLSAIDEADAEVASIQQEEIVKLKGKRGPT